MSHLSRIVLFIALVVGLAYLCAPQSGAGDESQETTTSQNAKPLPRMVDLGKTWCIPCKKMVPVLEEAKKIYKDRATIEFIDLDAHPEAAQTYKVMMMPTQVFYTSEGKEFERHMGFIPVEDIEKVFDKMGVKKVQ